VDGKLRAFEWVGSLWGGLQWGKGGRWNSFEDGEEGRMVFGVEAVTAVRRRMSLGLEEV
jgi:hypothetical protein